MTTITVKSEDPRAHEATVLLKASHALMQSLFPKEACHYLSVDDLCKPEIRFLVARSSGTVAGCGALAIKADYGEIKSMFTAENCRGQGIASAILEHIEILAKQNSVAVLRLETGDTLGSAHNLYLRHGYDFCGPFGSYIEHPNSLYMEKTL